MAEARASADDGDRPPPAGWQRPGGERAALDVEPLLELLASLREPLASLREPLAAVREPLALARERIPGDLQQRLAEATRELLLAIRALIDWQLERTEPGGLGSADRDGARGADAGPRDVPIV